MTGDGTIRLFVALDIPEDVRLALHEHGLRLGVGRALPAGSLHVTIAFLGRVPPLVVPDVGEVVRDAVRATLPPRLAPAGWRWTRTVGMVVLADGTGRARDLAERVQSGLERIGLYRREARAWLPHVSVVRVRERPRLPVVPPAIRTFVPSDAAAYLSRLHPTGARYEALFRYRWSDQTVTTETHETTEE